MTNLLDTDHNIVEVSPHRDEGVLDVYFIHGLGGNFRETWKNENGVVWPESWLKYNHNLNIYLVNYPVPKFIWGLTGKGMGIKAHAGAVVQMMLNKGLGRRDFVLVCHSMGGLLAKEILLECHETDESEHQDILSHAKGVMFIATPHEGSAIANIAALIPACSKEMSELKKNAPDLTRIAGRFQTLAKDKSIKVKSLYETKMTLGVLVVPKTSAASGCQYDRLLGVDADHFSIIKPSNPNELVYETICKFVRDIEPTAMEGVGNAPNHQEEAEPYEEELPFAALLGVMLNSDEDRVNRKEIQKCISKGMPIPTRYFYDTDWCADNWMQFSTLHGNTSELMTILTHDNITNVLTNCFEGGELSFVSIGPGDGRKDYQILDHASALNGRKDVHIRYYPIDISAFLIRGAIRNVTQLCDEHIKVSAGYIYGDISEIVYAKGHLPTGKKIFSMLGNTIGNMMKDGETLRNLGDIMSEGDALLLEVRSLDSKDKFVEASDGGSTNRHLRKASKFSFGPLETLGWEMKLDNFEVKPVTARLPSDVLGTETIMIQYNHDEGGKKMTAKLDRINFYNERNLKDYLDYLGFTTRHYAKTEENLYFLVEK
ncbi:MAG: L-histidine N(alpha)-methyltransferase [Rhodospirillales bacterium]|nr:L-histidine N(alpha)-methyltransferase [Rhodospirillales bacterium]